jgi:hypothetical protein
MARDPENHGSASVLVYRMSYFGATSTFVKIVDLSGSLARPNKLPRFDRFGLASDAALHDSPSLVQRMASSWPSLS